MPECAGRTPGVHCGISNRLNRDPSGVLNPLDSTWRIDNNSQLADTCISTVIIWK